jgi:hypothetical protein
MGGASQHGVEAVYGLGQAGAQGAHGAHFLYVLRLCREAAVGFGQSAISDKAGV